MTRRGPVTSSIALLALVLLAVALPVAMPTASAQTPSPPYHPSSGDISSTVVAQPDGFPSLFIEANGTIFNYWYADGAWQSYRMAFYTTAPPANAVTLGFATSRPVAVLQPDGSPSVFFQGVGGSLWNYWYADGTWDSAEILSSGVASAPVATLQLDGSPSVFFVGPGDSLLNYWYIPDGAASYWGGATIAGAGSTFQVPAAAQYDADAEWIFSEGPNHSLVWYYENGEGVWTGVTIGSAFSAPAVVEQPQTNTVSVFVAGPNGSLLNYWAQMAFGADCGPNTSNAGCGNSWSHATVVQAGLVQSSPAAMLQPVSAPTYAAPTVFFVGPDGSLLNYWYTPSGWDSGTVEPAGSTTSQVFGVLPQSSGAPEVFVAHEDGSLWTASYSQGVWTNFNFANNDAPVETYAYTS
ncbi:MAG TPA: hypothetical protein VED63_04175 [Acidimicrobiales bacterium]|nr:hypothetical protein [Acidimicrobiales bacterium]